MAEITDYDSAKAWLEGQDHQTQIWFASRCALRSVPGLFAEPDRTNVRLVLTSFRAMLISGAAGTCSTPKIRKLESAALSTAFYAVSAYSAADSAARSAARSAALSAANSARSALSAADSARSAARSAADSGLSAADSALSTAYSAANSDTQAMLEWGPLWTGSTNARPVPGFFDTPLANLRAFMAERPDLWNFWLEWYETILIGKPLDWGLSFRIATELTDEDWEKGGYDWEASARHVAERIAEIRAAWDVEQAAKDFKEELVEVPASDVLVPRGHNNPPELIEDESLAGRAEIIWAAVDDLEREAKAETPDLSKARVAYKTIRAWVWEVCKYLGRKTDLAIDTVIKWGIPAGGGYLLMNADKLQKLLQAAEKWLGQ